MAYLSQVAPVNRIAPLLPPADHSRWEGLFRAEKNVLRQESALARDGTITSAHYIYTPGPDGRLYITGATVTVRKKKEADPSGRTAGEKPGELSPSERDRELAAASSRLREIERDVIAHEAAHKAAGGQYAGAISYRYMTGPDGKSYIVGGEVPISAPGGDTPEETLRIMEQVKKAALSPGSPSVQDMRVAAAASAASVRALAEMGRQRAEKTYGESRNALSPGEQFALRA